MKNKEKEEEGKGENRIRAKKGEKGVDTHLELRNELERWSVDPVRLLEQVLVGLVIFLPHLHTGLYMYILPEH